MSNGGEPQLLLKAYGMLSVRIYRSLKKLNLLDSFGVDLDGYRAMAS